MKSVILYAVRHGKTICNEKRLYCGKSNVSLSDIGIEELNSLKNIITVPKCKLNYTSGAKRANETFEILYGHKNFQERLGFFEYNFGDFEMKSYEMLKEEKSYIDWIIDTTGTVKCPNGESKKEFYERITIALNDLIDEIIENGENEAVLLCHGGTIGTILELFSKEKGDFYSLQPSCGRGYKLKIDKEDGITISILGEI